MLARLPFIAGLYLFTESPTTFASSHGTLRAEHLLVAWLPEEGILFEADHFPNPINGYMQPAQPVTKHLARMIDKLGLNVKTIVGAHSPRIASIDDLRKALETEPVKLAQVSP